MTARRPQGVPRAPPGSAAVRHRHHRADHPADDARLCGDDRRAQRADGRRRSGPLDRQPRRWSAASRRRRTSSSSTAVRRVSEIDAYLDTRPRVDGADDSRRTTASGFARDSRRRCRSSPTAPTRTRRTWRWATPARLIAGYARELAAASRTASGPRRSSGGSARLVQPAAREPRLHDSRDPGAAAAGRHDEPVVDGDRARDANSARSSSST